VRGLCVGGDNRLYASQPGARRIVVFGDRGEEFDLDSKDVPEGLAVKVRPGKVEAHDLAISPSGQLYYIDPRRKAVCLAGRSKPVADGFSAPAGLVFWRDGGTLVVGEAAGKHLFAFRAGSDGDLDARERYYPLRVRPEQLSEVRSLTLDTQGRLYAATLEGVQVFDPTGRLCGVLTRPLRQAVMAVAFGGKGRERLYVLCGGRLWQRKTKCKGAWPPARQGEQR
jgi:enterochelin esterase family protein